MKFLFFVAAFAAFFVLTGAARCVYRYAAGSATCEAENFCASHGMPGIRRVNLIADNKGHVNVTCLEIAFPDIAVSQKKIQNNLFLIFFQNSNFYINLFKIKTFANKHI